MEISNRLKCIASMVKECKSIADIGTDHGYLPIYLINNDICDRAIASDINLGPLNRAKDNVERHRLGNEIICRQGAGLNTIKKGEVDCAVIAGMGGNLIRDILEERMDVFTSLKYAILQPVQNPEVLRKYLYGNGFEIMDEEICFDENKYYEIIKVSCDKHKNYPLPKDDNFYEIGEKLIEKKHSLLKEYITYKIAKNEKILYNIADKGYNAAIRKRELEAKISYLKEVLLCLLK